jgi:hypothetical protein
MQKLTQTDKVRLLSAIMNLEHKSKVRITPEEYQAMMRLAQAVDAPGFVTEYFARKMNTTTK